MSNLALHVVNTWLVFLILKRICSSQSAAFLAGLFFAVHPAHKGIAYISDRTGLLGACFFLVSLLLYISYRDSKTNARSWAYYAGSVIFCGLAAFSKEETLALPLVLVMVDIFFFPRVLKQQTVRQLALYLPFFLLPALYVLIRVQVVQSPIGMIDAFLIEPVRRLLTIPSLLLDYLLLLVFPVQLDYDARFPLIRSIWETRAWIGISAVVAALFAIIRLFNKNRPVAFGILWFLIVFLPMSNLIPIFANVAEKELFAPVHFLYLPSIGIFLCTGVGLEKAFCGAKEKRIEKRAFAFGILLIIMFFCLLSVRRNIIWKNEINFFTYVSRMHPERVSLRPHLAQAYMSAGDGEKAIRVFHQAVALDPDSSSVHKGLGVAYLKARLVEPAIREFQSGIRLKPDDADAYANLAVAYAEKGALAEAIAANAKAVELAPSSAHMHANFGLVLIRTGDYEKAEEQFRLALAISPEDEESLSALSWLAERKKHRAQDDEQRRQPTELPISGDAIQQNVQEPEQNSNRSSGEGKSF